MDVFAALADPVRRDLVVRLTEGDATVTELAEPHVSLWGMDNATTQIAVSVFLNRFLPRFLDRCASVPAPSFDPDDEEDNETDLDSEIEDD